MVRAAFRVLAAPLLAFLLAGPVPGAGTGAGVGSGLRVAVARSARVVERAAPGVPGRVPASGRYRLPLAGAAHVTRPFQPPPHPWLPGHRGVDLAAVPGATVFAAGSGVVAFAGVVAGVGVLSIDHPDGLRTTYEPVAVLLHAGQAVAAGQPVGTLTPGHPGCPVAACLHWGLRRGADYLDPLLLLHAGQVRLLPSPRADETAVRAPAERGRPARTVRPVA
jgi:murein DD-endopeptidase MepM/ murein hydrolase activator NlpD